MWRASMIVSSINLPMLKEYHCVGCGRLLLKANRELLAFWMGPGYPDREIPKGMGWVEHKCRGCQYVYNFYIQ